MIDLYWSLLFAVVIAVWNFIGWFAEWVSIWQVTIMVCALAILVASIVFHSWRFETNGSR